MKKLKECLSEFIILRVSVADKLDLIKRSKDSKNLSTFIRRTLGYGKK